MLQPQVLAPDVVDFREALAMAMAEPGMRKGERTRLAIEMAACELLADLPLSALKVQDICRRAGIAQGTFYIYFQDRHALVTELLQAFVKFTEERMLGGARRRSDDPVKASTEIYYRLFEGNRGLMKCLLSYYEEFPEARRVAQQMNLAWLSTVVAAAKRRLDHAGRTGAIAEDELYRRAYAVGGMVDQYLAALFLYGDEQVARVSEDPDTVVETLTLIWKRAMDIE